jgi:histone H2A
LQKTVPNPTSKRFCSTFSSLTSPKSAQILLSKLKIKSTPKPTRQHLNPHSLSTHFFPISFQLLSSIAPQHITMSTAGKGGKSAGKSGKGKSKSGGKSMSRSARAGLQFSVSRIGRYLKAGRYAARVGSAAPVYLAAVLEYLAAEVLELAGNACRENKKSRINPRHMQLAVFQDDELRKLLRDCTIAEGGVIPSAARGEDEESKVKKGGKSKGGKGGKSKGGKGGKGGRVKAARVARSTMTMLPKHSKPPALSLPPALSTQLAHTELIS